MTWTSSRAASVAVFVLALALRLLLLHEARLAPYADSLVLDAEEYQMLARGLVSGDWAQASEDTYVHGMLYPALWAVVMLMGGTPWAMCFLQAVLGAATCVLLQRAALRLMPPATALACGLLAAVYWPFVLYSSQLMATTLVLLLTTALLALMLRPGAPSASGSLAAGLVLALLTSTRANTALLAPVVLWWLVRTARTGGRSSWQVGALLAAGFVVGLTPFVAYNWSVQGTAVPFEGAWSFYMGNNPGADGTPYVRQGLGWQRMEALGFRDGWDATPAERGLVYLSEGLTFIIHEPGQTVALLWSKLRLFWNAFEVPVSVDLAWYNGNTWLGRLLPGFGLIGPLALVGMVAIRRRWQDWGLVYGGVLAFLVSGLLFTVCDRYRLPALPFLILFAGEALRLGAEVARGRARQRAVHLGLGLAAAAVWVYTGVDAAAVDHLRPRWLQASIHLRDGRVDTAEFNLRAAVEADPGDADVRNSLGVTQERLGRFSQAEATYREAVRRAPDFALAWLNLSDLKRRQQRLHEAEEAARKALAADPRPVTQRKGRIALAEVLLQAGRPEDALKVLGEALEIRDGAELRLAMAGACYQLNRIDDEAGHLERVVELKPGSANGWRNLGAARMLLDDLAGAEQALTRAAALDPNSPAVHKHLGVLYQRTDRPDLAAQAFKQARRLSRAPAGRR